MITKDDAWDIVEEYLNKTDGEIDDIRTLMDILDGMVTDAQAERQKMQDIISREKKEEPVMHSLVCKTCGMPFKSENPRAKTCPDCKKKAQARAMTKYQNKKKLADTAQELVRLGDDNA